MSFVCSICGKTISEDEYFVHWGGCGECFGKHYEAYLREKLMARKDVYHAIDSERDYQDAKWGPLPERSHEVGAWLTVMRHCLNKAEAAWTPQPTDVDALKEIRQIAAVAVACMEQHGVACRTIDGQECVAPE